MNKQDYKTVNAPAFIDAVNPIGRGARRFKQIVKRRWDAGGAREDGDLGVDDSTLWTRYESLSGWESRIKGEEWAYVWIVMPNGESRTIHTLHRHRDDKGFTIERLWSVVESVFGYLPENGALCAIWLGGTQSGSDRRTDLGPIRYRADNTPPPPPPPVGERGEDWPCFSDGRAPVVVMSPHGPSSDATWEGWLEDYDRIVNQPDWDGTHTPLTDEYPHYVRKLYRRNTAAGRVTSLWMSHEDTDPDDCKQFTQSVLSDLAPRETGWLLIEPTWDVQNNWSTVDVDDWVAFVQSLGFANVLVGARALPDRRYKGDYAAWEDHVYNLGAMPTVLKQEIGRSDNRPCANTERFRVRNKPAPNNKDWFEVDIPGGIILLRRHNVMGIFGIQDSRGSVSDYGCGGPTSEKSTKDIRLALNASAPPPPPVDPPTDPLPSEWALMAVCDQQWKVDVVREHTSEFGWLRSELSPRYLAAQGYDTVEKAARQGVDWWYGTAVKNGFDVVVGLYGSPTDLEVFGAPHNWQEYALRVGEMIAERGERIWFTADIELNPKFIEGGIDQYIDLWGGSVKVVERLQAMGHRVFGPGFTDGDQVANLARALAEIPFDAASIHSYNNVNEPRDRWLNECEATMRNAGYEWGVIGETSEDGGPRTLSEKYCPFDANAAQVQRARELKVYFAQRPFWRMKFWYQVLDDGPSDAVGYGLYRTVGPEPHNNWEPKPVATIFNPWVKEIQSR